MPVSTLNGLAEIFNRLLYARRGKQMKYPGPLPPPPPAVRGS